MFLFFKREEKAENNNSKSLDIRQNIIKALETYLVSKLMLLANELQRCSEHLSSTAKRFLLILFSLTGLGVSTYLIIKNSFSHNHIGTFSFKSIRLPNPIYKRKSDENNVNIISEKEFKTVEKFKKLFDSLSANSPDNKLKDSILKSRPGLFDSVAQFEKIYQLQEQNKK